MLSLLVYLSVVDLLLTHMSKLKWFSDQLPAVLPSLLSQRDSSVLEESLCPRPSENLLPAWHPFTATLGFQPNLTWTTNRVL